LDEAQRRAKEGDRLGVALFTHEMREKTVVWEALSSKIKARLIRAEGLAAIENDDLDQAQKLLDDADALHPASDRSAKTLLVYRRQARALQLTS